MSVGKIILGSISVVAIGGFGADAQINTLDDKGAYLERAIENKVENEGRSKVRLSKDEPRVVLSKWNDEVNLGVKYAKVKGKGNRKLLTNRVEWKDAKEELHAYPIDDSTYEIEVLLKEKPDTNVFNFEIDGAQDLDFFYQGELTQDEIAEGVNRPENVIGSYAVYHKTKANHRVGSTNYATGKAYHIYRPKAIDANGQEMWGTLSYSNGTLSVEVPQGFLDTAVYPVTIDPTFGYTSAGASNQAQTSESIRGSIFTLSENGNASSLTFYINYQGTNKNHQGAVYQRGPTTPNLAAIFKENTDTFTLDTSVDAWQTENLQTSISLGANDFWLVLWPDAPDASNFSRFFFDAGDTGQGNRELFANDGTFPWPDPTDINDTTTTNKYSIYATYTADATGNKPKAILKGQMIIDGNVIIK